MVRGRAFRTTAAIVAAAAIASCGKPVTCVPWQNATSGAAHAIVSGEASLSAGRWLEMTISYSGFPAPPELIAGNLTQLFLVERATLPSRGTIRFRILPLDPGKAIIRGLALTYGDTTLPFEPFERNITSNFPAGVEKKLEPIIEIERAPSSWTYLPLTAAILVTIAGVTTWVVFRKRKKLAIPPPDVGTEYRTLLIAHAVSVEPSGEFLALEGLIGRLAEEKQADSTAGDLRMAFEREKYHPDKLTREEQRRFMDSIATLFEPVGEIQPRTEKAAKE